MSEQDKQRRKEQLLISIVKELGYQRKEVRKHAKE